MQPPEPLRSPETTPEGRHLEMPGGFPHGMMARLAALTVGIVVVIGALSVFGGARAALIGGAILLLVVLPYTLVRLTRASQRRRAHEIEVEHRIEASEL
jgi:hypothetical protein